jgi:hypothetical protein
MDGKFAWRILAGLVLLAAVAGIAFLAYNAGVAQNLPLPAGAEAPALPAYRYGPYGWHPHAFFGFGCFGPLLALFLFFLALRAFGFLFWGARWGHWRHHGPHHSGWGGEGVPPAFEEWHRRAHNPPGPDQPDAHGRGV